MRPPMPASHPQMPGQGVNIEHWARNRRDRRDRRTKVSPKGFRTKSHTPPHSVFLFGEIFEQNLYASQIDLWERIMSTALRLRVSESET